MNGQDDFGGIAVADEFGGVAVEEPEVQGPPEAPPIPQDTSVLRPPTLQERIRGSGVMRELGREYGGGADVSPVDIGESMFRFASVPPPAANVIRKVSDIPISILPDPLAGLVTGAREVGLTFPVAAGAVGMGKNIGRALLGLFTGDFILNIPEIQSEFNSAWKRGDTKQAFNIATQAILGGALLTAAGVHEVSSMGLPKGRGLTSETQRQAVEFTEELRQSDPQTFTDLANKVSKQTVTEPQRQTVPTPVIPIPVPRREEVPPEPTVPPTAGAAAVTAAGQAPAAASEAMRQRVEAVRQAGRTAPAAAAEAAKTIADEAVKAGRAKVEAAPAEPAAPVAPQSFQAKIVDTDGSLKDFTVTYTPDNGTVRLVNEATGARHIINLPVEARVASPQLAEMLSNGMRVAYSTTPDLGTVTTLEPAAKPPAALPSAPAAEPVGGPSAIEEGKVKTGIQPERVGTDAQRVSGATGPSDSLQPAAPVGPQAAAPPGQAPREVLLKPAPAVLLGFDPISKQNLYNLTEDVPGHPKNSTVTASTLRQLGYSEPEATPSAAGPRGEVREEVTESGFAVPTLPEGKHYLFHSEAGDVASKKGVGNVFIVRHFNRMRDARELAKSLNDNGVPAKVEAWLKGPKSKSMWTVLVENVSQTFADTVRAKMGLTTESTPPKGEPKGGVPPEVASASTASPGASTVGGVAAPPAAVGQPTVTPTVTKGQARVFRGVSSQSRFNRETEAVGEDLLSWVSDNMRILSKSQALKQWGKQKFKQTGEYDDAPKMAAPHHNVIYDPKGSGPDAVAQAAYEAGKLSSPSVVEFWKTLGADSERRIKASKRMKTEARWLEEEAQQTEDWEKDTSKGQVKVTSDDLNVGDKIQVGDQMLDVTGVDADTGEVTVKDGPKYGIQKLPSGKNIYVESFTPEKVSAPESLFPEEEMPFNLAGEKGTLPTEKPPESVTGYGTQRLAQQEMFAIQKIVESKDPAKSADAAQTMYGGAKAAISKLEEQLRVIDTYPPKERKAIFGDEQRARLKEVLNLLRQRATMPEGPGAMTRGQRPYSAAQQLIDQLKAQPPAGVREKLSTSEKIADAWAQGKSAWNRAMARGQAITQTLKETARGVRSPTDVDRHVASLDWALQQSAGQSRIMGKQMERQWRNITDREAAAIWIDAGGDEALIQNVLANLPTGTRPNVRRAVARAANLPTNIKADLVNELRQFYSLREQDAVSHELFEQGLNDYFTHIWQKPENMPDELRAAITNGRVQTWWQFKQQREIPTFLNGIMQGKTPVLDPAKVLPFYNYSLDRAIASREFIKGLNDLTAPDGRPVVAPWGTSKQVPQGQTPQALIIKPTAKAQRQLSSAERQVLQQTGLSLDQAIEQGLITPVATADYRTIDHPAMRKWKWAGTSEAGAPILFESELAVHPDYYERLARFMDRGRLSPGPAVRSLLRASTEVKGMKLGLLSAFHQIHVGSHALWHLTNPFKSKWLGTAGEIDWESPSVQFAVEKGHLKLAPNPNELGVFAEGILGPGLIHKIPGIGPVSRAYSEWLFGDFIPRLKLATFENAYQRNMKWYEGDIRRGKITPEEVAARVGDSVNNAYGELNQLFLGKYGRSPGLQRILRGVFLAPDFGEARLRFVEKAFTKYGNEERMALALMFTTMYTAARVSNWYSHGDPEWDSKNAFRVKVGDHWWTMRSVVGDLAHAFSNLSQFMYVRLNPLYSRTVMDWLYSRDYQGRKLSAFDKVVKRPLEQLIPIQLGSLTRDDQKLWESFITAMGVSASHERPVAEVNEAVRKWMLSSGDPLLQAMGKKREQELFAPSAYAPLRRALLEQNWKKAKTEYIALRNLHDHKIIDRTLNPRTAAGEKPLGALGRKQWLAFLQSVKGGTSEAKSVAAALEERDLIYARFKQLMAGQQ